MNQGAPSHHHNTSATDAAGASFLELRSPAKLNVFLEIHGKRDDGFHELETVMLRTSLHDVLRMEATSSPQVTLRLAADSACGPAHSFPLDGSNLILQAARTLQDHAQTSQGAAILVNKRIPAEAGLAGGSSNAATALLGLNRLWGLQLSTQTLHELAAPLGSDVNFFVEDCRAAVCSGRGERIALIQPSGCFYIVAAQPESGNSTPEVFRHVSLPDRSERHDVRATVNAVQCGSSEALQAAAFNRLTAAAEQLNPQMTALRQAMQQITDRPVFMSGSGSTCFLMARNHRESQRLTARLRSLNCRWLAAFRVE